MTRNLAALALTLCAAACTKQDRSAHRTAPPHTTPPPPTVTPASDTALLILIQGTHRFIGDDSYAPSSDDPLDDPTPGTLTQAKQAATILATSITTGDVGIAFFGSTFINLIPLSHPSATTALDTVSQLDFKNERNRNFVDSVDLALTELERSPRNRKILVLISEGIDGNQKDIPIDPVVTHARKAGIIIHAFQVDPDVPFGDRHNMKALGELGTFRSTHNPDDLLKFAEELRVTLQQPR